MNDRLPFQLHDFVRITWVSADARARWAPRLAAIRDVIDRGDRGETAGPALGADAGARLGRRYPHEVDARRGQLAAGGLAIERIDLPLAQVSACCSQPLVDDERRSVVLEGHPDAVRSAREALMAGDAARFQRALGTPDCCADVLVRRRALDLRDPTWPSAAGVDPDPALRHVTLRGPVPANVLLHRLGLWPLAHRPCTLACAATGSALRARLAGGDVEADRAALADLADILSWPVSWSMLHGVAELKLPVLKAIHDTDATASRYQIEIDSPHLPTDAAIGLGFPFRAPPSRRLTTSAGFARGLANPLDVVEPIQLTARRRR